MRRSEIPESPDDISIGSSLNGETGQIKPELVVVILDLFRTDRAQDLSNAYELIIGTHIAEYQLNPNFKKVKSIDEFTKLLHEIPNQMVEQLAQAHLSVILNFPRPDTNSNENWLDLLLALSEVAKIEKQLKVTTSDNADQFIIPVIIATYEPQEVLARINKTVTKNPDALPICLKTKENAIVSIIDQSKDRFSEVLFQRLARFLPETHIQRIPPFTQDIENTHLMNSSHPE